MKSKSNMSKALIKCKEIAVSVFERSIELLII